MSRRGFQALAAALALAGAVSFGQGIWILAKARLAQVLLEHAWERTQGGEDRVRPWPWADTYPVARLRAPGQDDLVVLAGASGRTLAFGPAHVGGSAAPGAAENSVLAGHRDTHFAFLRDLEPGDELSLETPTGALHRYRVRSAEVLHESRTDVIAPAGEKLLTLVTCWPFDALVPGGPLRFVVRAEAVTDRIETAALGAGADRGRPSGRSGSGAR